jgi:hypothetical protein
VLLKLRFAQELAYIQFSLEVFQLLLNFVFTFGDLELIGVIEFDRRLQREKMLWSVISFQGLDDLFGGGPDLRMFHLGQLEPIAFSSQDRPNDGH